LKEKEKAIEKVKESYGAGDNDSLSEEAPPKISKSTTVTNTPSKIPAGQTNLAPTEDNSATESESDQPNHRPETRTPAPKRPLAGKPKKTPMKKIRRK